MFQSYCRRTLELLTSITLNISTKPRIRTVVVMLMALAVTIPAAVDARPNFDHINGSTMQLRAGYGSSLCLDISNVSQDNGAALHQWGCHSGSNQRFYFRQLKNGAYIIQPTHTWKCLDVDSWSQKNGAKIQQWDCHYGKNQQWLVRDRGDYSYKFESVNAPGKCIDIQGASRDQGTWMILWTCHRGWNQVFEQVR